VSARSAQLPESQVANEYLGTPPNEKLVDWRNIAITLVDPEILLSNCVETTCRGARQGLRALIPVIPFS
jgi:hypothetical protein